MAGEVPSRQLRKRGVAVEALRAGHSFLEQRIRQLTAASGTTAHDRIELGAHDQKRETRTVGDDAGAAERRLQLGARQMLPAAQCSLDHGAASRERTLVEIHLAVVVGVDRVDARAAEREHPPDVVARHEVPRLAQDVRPDDRSLVTRSLDLLVSYWCTQADGPFRTGVILRLHRSQPRHHVLRRTEGRAQETLIRETAPDEIVHAFYLPSSIRGNLVERTIV